ncbi:coagulation factor IIIa [Thalassophryne amazonica]|uniref:coagulation factor IIIa n=1 Tax=Thalassophryne amazonica TaxID=390379 RepID=UPI001471CD74|nr:coagulation factor IIIa [Thalassophryne amazonica]
MPSSRLPAAFVAVLFVCSQSVSGSYPKAQNVTWESTNFKTLLTWEPKPSKDYSYTVEFSAIGENRHRNPHCIRTPETSCDLTRSLTDLKAVYSADVLSEPPLGVTSDLIEFPHTSSPKFCPYEDTVIGKPDFKLDVSEDKKKTTLYVSDPVTALFKDGRQLTIRDIFSEELQYKVTYRKAKSSGRKEYFSKNSTIELTNLDQRESYCFYVQAYIPSRRADKQLGDFSQTQCSRNEDASIFEMYSVGVIIGAIFFILLLISIIVAVTVSCYKCRKNAQKRGKDSVPLNSVIP